MKESRSETQDWGIGEEVGPERPDDPVLRAYRALAGTGEDRGRTEAGYRLYRDEDLRRLKFVKNARNAGLTLGEIKEVLAFHERGEAPCSYVTGAIARRAEEVDRQITELTKFKKELDRLHEQARVRPAGEAKPDRYCHIIESVR